MMKRAWILLPVLAAALAGCQPAGPMIVKGDLALSGADSAAYLDTLASRNTVTQADALEGMLLVLGQDGGEKTFARAIEILSEKKIVSPAWRFQADANVTKGRVAYMVYQACGLRGGVTLALAGPSQRYCLKELQYLGLMSQGQTYNTVTGMEYVAILARADELRQTGKVSDVMKKEEGAE